MAPTVLITGASEGIGKATALLFSQQGYDLVIAARHAEGLEALAQEVQSFGGAAPLKEGSLVYQDSHSRLVT